LGSYFVGLPTFFFAAILHLISQPSGLVAWLQYKAMLALYQLRASIGRYFSERLSYSFKFKRDVEVFTHRVVGHSEL